MILFYFAVDKNSQRLNQRGEKVNQSTNAVRLLEGAVKHHLLVTFYAALMFRFVSSCSISNERCVSN